MARKRRRRRSNPAPLILIALALAAIVIWAIVPRKHPAVTPRAHPIAQAPVSAEPAATASPSPGPSAIATQAASPSPLPGNAPQLAIVIDDCGQWPATEQGYIALPIPLTLAVLPRLRYTAQIADEASAAGKGVMLHLPMEPISHKNPGPGEITTAMTDEEVTAETESDLAQVPLAAGVNNHEGSEASADRRVMSDVIDVVKKHGLFFIDSRTSANTVAASAAQAAGVPNASRDVFLDDTASVAYTELMLRRAVEVAKRKGSAIAIGHPKATTLEALRAMYPEIEAQGVRFVEASKLVR
jgi:polysaccharide deacetylase 2 family uncharacterized protein YibQ